MTAVVLSPGSFTLHDLSRDINLAMRAPQGERVFAFFRDNGSPVATVTLSPILQKAKLLRNGIVKVEIVRGITFDAQTPWGAACAVAAASGCEVAAAA